MNSKKFNLLSMVSLTTSLMLWVDGWFSRAAVKSGVQAGNLDVGNQLAFWRLWVPLLMVQIVVVVLVHRDAPSPVQRNISYFGIFFFVIASLFALTGFEQFRGRGG